MFFQYAVSRKMLPMSFKDIETGLSKKEVARKHDVPLSTLWTWFKNEEKIINAVRKGKGRKTKNVKAGRNDELDQAVYKYFINLRSQNIPVSGPILKWLDRWKAQYHLQNCCWRGKIMHARDENKPPC